MTDVGITVEVQRGWTHDDVVAAARAAEVSGFTHFFRSDHYADFERRDARVGPSDAWLTLAGLARETSRIGLGTLVSPVTFRTPAVLGLLASQVDQMSGGRLVVGLGAGWFEAEHRAFGLAFPPPRERLERLVETIVLLRRWWAADEALDVPASDPPVVALPPWPKPVQGSPRIIVGGRGARVASIAVRLADELNVDAIEPARFAALRAQVDAKSEGGREVDAPLRCSVSLTVCCGTSEAEVGQRLASIGAGPGDELRRVGAVGSPAQVRARIGEYVDAGADAVYLQLLDPSDIQHIEELGEQVGAARFVLA